MSATSIELKAPAKLNLFLHVVGRRTDGMHLLESVFVLIDLCDDIVLELDPSGKISARATLSATWIKTCAYEPPAVFSKSAAQRSDAASTLQSAFQRVQAWAEVLATVRAL